MLNGIKNIGKELLHTLVIIFLNPVFRYVFKCIRTSRKLMYNYYIAEEFKSIDVGYLLESPVVLMGGKYISIGKGFSSRARLRIEAWDKYLGNIYTPRIVIGDNVVINFDCHIGAVNLIEIGDNVLIGSNVLITDHSHGMVTKEGLQLIPCSRPLYSKGPVIIKENVWIGENVAILPNVTIGKNAVIGANAVVSKDIPDNCLAGGNPARVIKYL